MQLGLNLGLSIDGSAYLNNNQPIYVGNKIQENTVDIYYCADSSATGIEILIDNHNST